MSEDIDSVGEDKSNNPSVYQKLQSERDALKSEVERLKGQVELDERVPQLERRLNQLTDQVVQAEATITRNRLIQDKYPNLRGYEEFIPLGTEADMEVKAKKLTERLGGAGSSIEIPSNEPLKNPADNNASVQLSDEEFERVVMEAPTIEKAKELYERQRIASGG